MASSDNNTHDTCKRKATEPLHSSQPLLLFLIYKGRDIGTFIFDRNDMEEETIVFINKLKDSMEHMCIVSDKDLSKLTSIEFLERHCYFWAGEKTDSDAAPMEMNEVLAGKRVEVVMYDPEFPGLEM